MKTKIQIAKMAKKFAKKFAKKTVGSGTRSLAMGLTAATALLFGSQAMSQISIEDASVLFLQMRSNAATPEQMIIGIMNEEMILEEVTELVLSLSDTNVLATALTQAAICMAKTDEQAYDVAGRAIDNAPQDATNAVMTRAQETLDLFRNGGCIKSTEEQIAAAERAKGAANGAAANAATGQDVPATTDASGQTAAADGTTTAANTAAPNTPNTPNTSNVGNNNLTNNTTTLNNLNQRVVLTLDSLQVEELALNSLEAGVLNLNNSQLQQLVTTPSFSNGSSTGTANGGAGAVSTSR